MKQRQAALDLSARATTYREGADKQQFRHKVRELLHDEPATDLAGEFELKGIEGKTSLYKLVD